MSLLLIVQFNDGIKSVQFTKEQAVEEICLAPNKMIKLQMVRNQHDRVFFAETDGSSDTLYKVKHHSLIHQ